MASVYLVKLRGNEHGDLTEKDVQAFACRDKAEQCAAKCKNRIERIVRANNALDTFKSNWLTQNPAPSDLSKEVRRERDKLQNKAAKKEANEVELLRLQELKEQAKALLHARLGHTAKVVEVANENLATFMTELDEDDKSKFNAAEGYTGDDVRYYLYESEYVVRELPLEE